MTANNDS